MNYKLIWDAPCCDHIRSQCVKVRRHSSFCANTISYIWEHPPKGFGPGNKRFLFFPTLVSQLYLHASDVQGRLVLPAYLCPRN